MITQIYHLTKNWCQSRVGVFGRFSLRILRHQAIKLLALRLILGAAQGFLSYQNYALCRSLMFPIIVSSAGGYSEKLQGCSSECAGSVPVIIWMAKQPSPQTSFLGSKRLRQSRNSGEKQCSCECRNSSFVGTATASRTLTKRLPRWSQSTASAVTQLWLRWWWCRWLSPKAICLKYWFASASKLQEMTSTQQAGTTGLFDCRKQQ